MRKQQVYPTGYHYKPLEERWMLLGKDIHRRINARARQPKTHWGDIPYSNLEEEGNPAYRSPELRYSNYVCHCLEEGKYPRNYRFGWTESQHRAELRELEWQEKVSIMDSRADALVYGDLNEELEVMQRMA